MFNVNIVNVLEQHFSENETKKKTINTDFVQQDLKLKTKKSIIFFQKLFLLTIQ